MRHALFIGKIMLLLSVADGSHFENRSSDFSRQYCYIVWSAIGIMMSSVRLSVCLWRYAFWLSRSVYRA